MATTKANPRRYTGVTAAAEYAGCSTKTIRRYIASGKLTGYRMGPKLLRIDLNELEGLLRPIPTTGGGRVA